MAVMITDDCIACGACEAECPNNAIYNTGDPYMIGGEEFPALNDDHTYIVPDKCTECIGFYDEPQCIPACPTDAIVKDPNRVETHEVLMARKEHLDAVGR
ncbi:MAG: 4Fe-4S binding protein [Ignavibacteriales bacterium]|jgi:ferredoxin|nr:4Fe-4S binding protein [Ignavibacteriaceae bacterium]NLH60157.1 4Fe-4S binding protein [Ignavibacteriales bacterium]HOJ17275.1 4Fe-4S binding protein [Ignavibacteriaceae bacterium]HPO54464.1 4Fe-4S binding protein [Ignavibacteriaceae bacterium]